LHDWLIGVWYGSGRGGWLLAPLGWLFALVAVVRRALYRGGILRVRRASCPVVVVGNITVGGTGKTPLVIWLAERLAAEGFEVGVASRGYGGTFTEPIREVRAADDAREVGDEPLVIARRTRARVAVGGRRADVVRHLEGRGVDLVICDDGLQHYGLGRDVEVAVIDGERRLGNGRQLPAGPLREPASRLAQIPWVFCNGGRASPGEIAMRVVGRTLRRIGDDGVLAVGDLRGRTCHAVAAIGNPERFFETLRESGADVHPHPLPDHDLIDGEIDRIPAGEIVIMTEKDAVKYRGERRGDTWYLPVEAHPDSDADRLLAEIIRLCGDRGGHRDADRGKN
jgi:tetraacyldisaccharide 4'-kinase